VVFNVIPHPDGHDVAILVSSLKAAVDQHVQDDWHVIIQPLANSGDDGGITGGGKDTP